MRPFLMFLVLMQLTPSWADTGGLCDTGLQAFEKTLYPLLQDRCTQCHAAGKIAPPHSSRKLSEAYSYAKLFADFSSIAESRFVEKIDKKHWLSVDPDAEGATVQEMTSALTAWWESGESKCPYGMAYQSAAIPIPSGLPTRQSGNFATLSWDVRGFDSCTFSVEIQQYNNVGDANDKTAASYRLRNPRMQCANRSLQVAGLRFVFSGFVKPYENVYETVAQSIPAGSPKPTLLSSELMIVLQRNPSGDSLAFALDQLQ